MNMKRKLAGFSACALVLSSMTVPVAHAASTDFKDIDSHWAKGSIERWASYEVVKGVGNDQFKPEDTMTRAQMAQILANTLGLTATATTNPFTDVKDSDWFSEAILKCNAAGIMKGTSDTTANPNGEISRQDAVTMLGRALGIEADGDSTTFDDNGNIGSWAAGYVNAMFKRGIVNGRSEGVFAPTGQVKRCEIATILDRAITTYVNTPNTEVIATGKGIILIAAPGVTVKGEAEDILIAPAAAGTTKLDSVKVSGVVTMQAADGTLVFDGKTTVAKLNIPALAIGAKITIGKDATVATVHSEADNVAIDGSGSITEMTVASGKGVTIAGSVKVAKITNNSPDPVKKGNTTVAANTTWNGTTSSGGGGGSSGGGGGGGGGSRVSYSNLTVGFAENSAVKGSVISVTQGKSTNTATLQENGTYQVRQDTDVTVAVKFDKTVGAASYEVGGATNPIAGVQGKDTSTFDIPAAQFTNKDNVAVTITATESAPQTYTITKGTLGEGVQDVTFSPASPVAAGTVVTVTPEFKDGYELDTITVSGADVNENKFTMPAANVTVDVSAKRIVKDIALTVAFAEGENLVNGSVTSVKQNDKDVSFENGTYTVKSDTDVTIVFEFDEAVGNATCSIGTMDAATSTVIISKDELVNAANNDAVIATITGYAVGHERYSVTEGTHSEGVQSVIFDPTGDQEKDTEVTVTPTLADGYILDKIEIKYNDENGAEQTQTVTDGKFTMPAANVTVVVTAKKQNLQIQPLGGTSGATPYMNLSVLKNGELVSEENPAQVGDTIMLIALAPAGYQIKGTGTGNPVEPVVFITDDEATSIQITETDVPADATDGIKAWTFTMPAKGVTASLEAEQISHNVTFNPGDGGTLTSGTASVKVVHGGKLSADQKPGDPTNSDSNKVFGGWYFGDTKVNLDDLTVNIDMELTAKWITEYTITDDTASNANVTLSFMKNGVAMDLTTDKAHEGDTITVTAVPADNFSIETVSSTEITTLGDGEAIGNTGAMKYEFTMPAKNVTITATAVATTYTVTWNINKDAGETATVAVQKTGESDVADDGELAGLNLNDTLEITLTATSDIAPYDLVVDNQSNDKLDVTTPATTDTGTKTIKQTVTVKGNGNLVITVNTAKSLTLAPAKFAELKATGSSDTISTTWDDLTTAVHYYDMATAYIANNSSLTDAEKTPITTTLKNDYAAIKKLTVSGGATRFRPSTGVFTSFTGLEDLTLSNTGVTQAQGGLDLGGLQTMTQLKKLDISNNTFAVHLNAQQNAVVDIGALEGMTALTTLNLSNTNITEINAVDKMKALQTLNLSNCTDLQQVGFSAIAGATALTDLNLSSCTGLTSGSPLASLTKLVTLNLSGCTALSDFNANHLTATTTLEELNISDTPVSGFSFLNKLTALTTFTAQNLTPGSESINALRIALETTPNTPADGLTDLGKQLTIDLTGLKLDNLNANDKAYLTELKSAYDQAGLSTQFKMDTTIE